MTREEFLQEFPILAKDYQPAPDVLAKINGVELLIVIGPSGVGKSALIDELHINFVPSCTTRSPRPGEIEGRDFFFLHDYQRVFDDIETGRFVQVAVGPGGDFYATKASNYPARGLAALPIVADVVPIFRKLGFKNTTSIFIVPPDFDEWMRRMGVHHLTGEQLERRLREAKRSIMFALKDKQVHFIMNDQLDDAVSQVRAVLDGKVDSQRETQARQAAENNLKQLEENAR